MKNILFISKGEQSSSTRYRALQYFPHFKAQGWVPMHVTISGGIIAMIKAFLAAKNADVVVLLRKTFPYPIFWILRKLSKKLIFDFDDAIFCNTDGTHSPTRYLRFEQTISGCDHVFAGNEYLAREAKKFNPSTSLIPTSLEVEKYNLNYAKNKQHIELVWIGSSSTRKYLEAILPSIEQAVTRIPTLALKVIADFELFSKALKIINIQWSEEVEAIELCKADIGIAPMPEDNWTKGKCALKVLQYMASGLPVLSSSSGVNADVVENGVNGYLVAKNADWADLLVKLSDNKNHLAMLGERGKCKVTTEYSIQAVFHKISNVVQSLQ